MRQKQKSDTREKTLEEQFPNEAKLQNGKQREVPEGNYFENHDLEVIRKKYIQFTVYMESLNDVLELGRNASLQDLANRIRDIVYASQREK